MAENIKTYTSKEMLPEALASAGIVLVDLWAAWCGPCRMVAPILEQIANENEGKITVAKLNVDDYAADAVKLGVMSIPTMILFKDGQEVDRLTGAYPKPAIQAMINKHL